MSSPEGIILEQFYDKLKEIGIKVGNKVKLRNGDIDSIEYIDMDCDDVYPIVLMSGATYTIDGNHILGNESVLDIVDWNYDEVKDRIIKVDNKINYGSHQFKGKSEKDIFDCNYKVPETITPNHPDVSYWDNGEVAISNNGFIKHDKGKPMISLVEPSFIEGLAEVMTQGASKYGRDNWQECKEPHRYLDALLRHTLKYWDGEKVDTESGKSHLYHIAFNAMALDYLDNKLKD